MKKNINKKIKEICSCIKEFEFKALLPMADYCLEYENIKIYLEFYSTILDVNVLAFKGINIFIDNFEIPTNEEEKDYLYKIIYNYLKPIIGTRKRGVLRSKFQCKLLNSINFTKKKNEK